LKKHIRFIINPISGVGKKNKLPRLIEKYLDQDQFTYDTVYTERKNHAKELAEKAVEAGIEIVCAVGGDGSVHEVGTALIGTPTMLAVIPAGSGNGLARHLNIPLDMKDAIYCINRHASIAMDTVKVNDNSFLGVGGYGLDAIVAREFDQNKKRGFLQYIYLTIREFLRFHPFNVTIDVDGKVKKLPVVLLTVANASQFGNGFTVSPKSNVTDGKLELVVLKPFSVWSIPSLIYRFFTSKSDRSRYSEIISFKKARIHSSKNVAHYDGEPTNISNDINIEVVPKSLHILVGKDYL
jgi:YegS/Rv2252/BmrU family lipid kinase